MLYGNYGFWSWLQYWFIDTYNQVTMRLIDKGYYDYDYEYREKEKEITAKAKSNEEMQQRLARFGFATRMVKEETPEELQQLAMSENED